MVRMRSQVRFLSGAPVKKLKTVNEIRVRNFGAVRRRPVGQVVKTPPFHGGNRGSNPLRVTNLPLHLTAFTFTLKRTVSSAGRAPALQAGGRRFDPVTVHHPHESSVILQIAGWSSSVARRAHNPKVAGSNPAPATNIYCRTRGAVV